MAILVAVVVEARTAMNWRATAGRLGGDPKTATRVLHAHTREDAKTPQGKP